MQWRPSKRKRRSNEKHGLVKTPPLHANPPTNPLLLHFRMPRRKPGRKPAAREEGEAEEEAEPEEEP